jgi:hypothetical protein
MRWKLREAEENLTKSAENLVARSTVANRTQPAAPPRSTVVAAHVTALSLSQPAVPAAALHLAHAQSHACPQPVAAAPRLVARRRRRASNRSCRPQSRMRARVCVKVGKLDEQPNMRE